MEPSLSLEKNRMFVLAWKGRINQFEIQPDHLPSRVTFLPPDVASCFYRAWRLTLSVICNALTIRPDAAQMPETVGGARHSRAWRGFGKQSPGQATRSSGGEGVTGALAGGGRILPPAAKTPRLTFCASSFCRTLWLLLVLENKKPEHSLFHKSDYCPRYEFPGWELEMGEG